MVCHDRMIVAGRRKSPGDGYTIATTPFGVGVGIPLECATAGLDSVV